MSYIRQHFEVNTERETENKKTGVLRFPQKKNNFVCYLVQILKLPGARNTSLKFLQMQGSLRLTIIRNWNALCI